MKKIYLTVIILLLAGASKSQSFEDPNLSLSQIDFNYINKGVWELSNNGYMPREDLKLINLYGAKQQSTDWYFMCHKICKNGVDLGYIITGKPNSASTVVHNLFFLKQVNTNATTHNSNKIEQLSTLGVDKMFLFRTTTVEKYNLDSECPK